jgi:hypothetical protein
MLYLRVSNRYHGPVKESAHRLMASTCRLQAVQEYLLSTDVIIVDVWELRLASLTSLHHFPFHICPQTIFECQFALYFTLNGREGLKSFGNMIAFA